VPDLFSDPCIPHHKVSGSEIHHGVPVDERRSLVVGLLVGTVFKCTNGGVSRIMKLPRAFWSDRSISFVELSFETSRGVASPDSPYRDLTVCVVDDDISIRESISGLLRAEGIRVEAYASANEFFARVTWESPACLILDIDLPGLSRVDLERELERLQVVIPTIFLTGDGDPFVSDPTIQARALNFVTLPVDPDDLLGAIQEGLLTHDLN
jgi:CheY-like chemotaxis protein